jgi:hypothetical protein
MRGSRQPSTPCAQRLPERVWYACAALWRWMMRGGRSGGGAGILRDMVANEPHKCFYGSILRELIDRHEVRHAESCRVGTDLAYCAATKVAGLSAPSCWPAIVVTAVV